MHPKFKPNKAFFKYLKDEYSKAKHGYAGVSISDTSMQHLLNAAYGWTAWFRSKEGAKILFRIIGIRDMPPHDGFLYYYVPPHGVRQRIDTSHGLRIFKKVPGEIVDHKLSWMDIAKRVVYTEGWKVPPDDAFNFVYRSYRVWLRLSPGIEWCKSSYKPIMHTYALDGLAYKATSVKGETYWFNKTYVESEPKEQETCEACDYDFPCTDEYTGLGRLCNRCYAENFADSHCLSQCNRPECEDYACHNYLEDKKFYETAAEIDKLPIKYTAAGG
jgi:hypothetical protein